MPKNLPGHGNGQQIQIEVVAIFLIIFGAHVNILLIIKVNILVLIKWSCRVSPIVLTIECKMISIF